MPGTVLGTSLPAARFFPSGLASLLLAESFLAGRGGLNVFHTFS